MSGKYFDISEIEAAVKYAYALAEDENSPIVEGHMSLVTSRFRLYRVSRSGPTLA